MSCKDSKKKGAYHSHVIVTFITDCRSWSCYWSWTGGAGSEVWNWVYMIAPVKKLGRVRLSTNFPSKQIWRRMQTWKDNEVLPGVLLGFKFSRVQTSRKGVHELFWWNFWTSGGMMYEQSMGDFTFRDSASGQVQLFYVSLSSVNLTSDQPAPSLIFFHSQRY